MAELTTVAHPYAEALFRAAKAGNLGAWSKLVSEMRQIAAMPDMEAVADDPKLSKTDVAGIFLSALKPPASHKVRELVGLLVADKRLSLLPEITTQFHVLRNTSKGAADVKITNAFPLEGAPLTELVATFEHKFGKKLQTRVGAGPSLIGGVRAQIGNEVLCTSVHAHLTQMQSTLTAA